MFKNLLKMIGGDPHKKELQRLEPVIDEINQLEPQFEALSDQQLTAKTAEFRMRLQDELKGMTDDRERKKAEQDVLNALLPEAFAAVREAGKRTIGLRHYDVQLIGGYTLHIGRIAEMRTGEGKTLVATLPLYLNALTGRGVHLVTVNDYLARRDARWMAPIYQMLGLSVGVLQMAARTNNGTMAFLVDLEKTSSIEDQHQLRMVFRREAYQADITYGTNSEFGFDYLRDNLTMSLEERVQRGHYYSIVDEVDNILIDEARTPLIISGPASEDTGTYNTMAALVRQLNPEDYEVNEKDHSVSMTEVGEAHVEQILGQPLRDPERPEDITPEQARLLGYLEQALKAQFLYRRNKEYLVQAGKVVIVDEFTGRLMPGRRWSEGLHQAVEAKEGVRVEPENVTYATITLQNYFRMYQKLAGMTGTALTEAEEFSKIYRLDVFPIPTNLEYSAAREQSGILEIEAKDEAGYKYTSYVSRDDPQRKPLFWKRKDYTDVVYRSEESKLRAIIQEIVCNYVLGRPTLVGTISVEHSERLSDRLQAEQVRRLLQTLMLRYLWMKKNHVEMIEKTVPELQVLSKPLSGISPADLRPLAKSLDATLNLEDSDSIAVLLEMLGLSEAYQERLVSAIKGGVPHQVLNARRHDEESLIIARAGAYGMVTIATNMAGRGVDIKLGGELPEDVLRDTNRVLNQVTDDPYGLTNSQRLALLEKLEPEQLGIYEESVQAFRSYMQNMSLVRELGGLHVIGSERHESRRIDNQLRGRAARQGDPGSSRFYLSLEDDLMRLFGGAQVEGIWKRMMTDDSQPLEIGLLGRLVEQSQERVEGSNFDVRKHLLEYDDVLNTQRQRIYGQRDRVFTKEDLSEDVLDMLNVELENRVQLALKDAEGPWKLLAFLEEIQPAFEYMQYAYPSFSYRLIIDDLADKLPEDGAAPEHIKQAALQVSEEALHAEKAHTIRSVEELMEKTAESYQRQSDERLETLDNFFAGLQENSEEEEQEPRKAAEIVIELSELLRFPIKLNNEQMRLLLTGDDSVRDAIQQTMEQTMLKIIASRLAGALERRLDEPLEIKISDLSDRSWNEIGSILTAEVNRVFEQRASRLLGDQGAIQRDIDTWLARENYTELDDRTLTRLLVFIARGTKTAFDARTHRKALKEYNRLNYVFLAARLIEDSGSEDITQRVVEHFRDGLLVLEKARGKAEWDRLALAEVSLNQLDEKVLSRLKTLMGEEAVNRWYTAKLTEIEGDDALAFQQSFGRIIQNEINRQLLLRVISDQWVEYLTEIEALRVSIGMEAYAQRDPLVQYKGKASELFQKLMSDIRMGVISRLFTYQMRRAAGPGTDLAAVPEKSSNAANQPTDIAHNHASSAAPSESASVSQDGDGKKKRRRRR